MEGQQKCSLLAFFNLKDKLHFDKTTNKNGTWIKFKKQHKKTSKLKKQVIDYLSENFKTDKKFLHNGLLTYPLVLVNLLMNENVIKYKSNAIKYIYCKKVSLASTIETSMNTNHTCLSKFHKELCLHDRLIKNLVLKWVWDIQFFGSLIFLVRMRDSVRWCHYWL